MAKIDSETVYQELMTMLANCNLQWVARQVAETVNAGKIIEDKMPRRMYPALKIIDFTESEKLSVLLESIARSLVQITEMEKAIDQFWQKTEGALKPEIVFYDASELEDQSWHFTSSDIETRIKHCGQLKILIDRVQNATIEESLTDHLLRDLKAKCQGLLNPHFSKADRVADLFKIYIFTLVLAAAKNEGATITYKNVDNLAAEKLILRQIPSKIHGTTRPYTHALIAFPHKPLLEAHIGVKLQGRSWVLHECDILVLHEQEAHICRHKKREPRTSRVVLVVETSYAAATLKLEAARNFLGLVSDIRVKGNCYFVSNSYSPGAAKLLTNANKTWEHKIFPSSLNDVNRFVYGLQSMFKDFQARY